MFNKILNKNELKCFLSETDFSEYKKTELSSVYFLINNNGTIEPIHFHFYENSYFPSPCVLEKTMPANEVEDYVRRVYETEYIEEALEYELSMCRNGYHYEIECPQCVPFLSFYIEIIEILTDEQCLDWLLAKEANK